MYKNIRDTVSEVYLESKTDGLGKVMKTACGNQNVKKSGQRDLLMALFKEVTTKIGSNQQPPSEVNVWYLINEAMTIPFTVFWKQQTSNLRNYIKDRLHKVALNSW